jgi:hypothetical protein
LNLLDAFGAFAPVREIAEKSFAFRSTRHRIDSLDRKRDAVIASIREKLVSEGVAVSIDDVRGYERLASVLDRVQRNTTVSRAELRHGWLRQNVLQGRVVTQGRSGKRLFLVLNVSGEKVVAMRDDGQGATFELSRVNRIYEKKYQVKENDVEKAFFDVFEGKNPPLTEPKTSPRSAHVDETTALLSGLVEAFVPPQALPGERDRIFAALSDSIKEAESLGQIERDIDFLHSEIWMPFENRAKVLDHFGYLDFQGEKVTERGKWLADLRVDRPLLVGEALRRGLFDDLEHRHVAGFMAALAADSDRNYGDLYVSDKLLDLLSRFDAIIFDVTGIEMKFGVETVEELNYSAAAAAERWAGGMSWDDLVNRTKAEEGDLFRLLARTGEALLQVANLKEANPTAASIARVTAESILREPVR